MQQLLFKPNTNKIENIFTLEIESVLPIKDFTSIELFQQYMKAKKGKKRPKKIKKKGKKGKKKKKG